MRLHNYLEYRRQGLRNAWHLAGMGTVLHASLRFLLAVLVALAVMHLISARVHAEGEAADNRVAAKVASQAAYIASLEAVVAACLSDGLGRPVQIGDQWVLCGTYPLGKF